VRVVIAEDHVLLRDGLIRLLSANGFEVAAAVDSGPLLHEALVRHRPDVAVVDAVRRVAAGGTAMDFEVISQLLGRQAGPVDRLTEREREVLVLIAEGRSNTAIAQRMFVSEKAVGKHISRIFSKLDLPPSDTDNRRVMAVLAHLQAAPPVPR
jgi:DNA-binding NarL/FixJ family response regulator